MGSKQQANDAATVREEDMTPAEHRRVLDFFNQAVQPRDLMYRTLPAVHGEEDPVHEDDPDTGGHKPERLLDRETAEKVFEFREWEHPLGFRHMREITFLDRRLLDILLRYFSDAVYGRWSTFPHPIPRRGPGSYDGVVHAALLHNGKVLFITADETDTEQRVLEMPYVHDHANPTRLGLTAPHGGHPHSLAPQGYYMLFALNNQGVPSVASWIYLH